MQDFSPGDVLIDDPAALLISRYDIEAVMAAGTAEECLTCLHDPGLVRVPWSSSSTEDGLRIDVDEEVHPALGLSQHMQSILQHAWNRGEGPCMMGVSNTTFETRHFLRMQAQVRKRLDCVENPARIMLEVVTQPDEQARALLTCEPIRGVVQKYVEAASVIAGNSLDVGCGDSDHQLQVLSVPVAMANHSLAKQNALYWICEPAEASAGAEAIYDLRVRVLLHACLFIAKGEQIFLSYQTLPPSPSPEDVEAYVACMRALGIDDREPITSRPKPAVTEFRYPCPPICNWLNTVADEGRHVADRQRSQWDDDADEPR